jgi:enoyl-CoA hydratase
VFEEIARSPKPTIAAINGMALGGGLELALACDIRIASDGATFALPELTWSMLPAAGGLTRLARVVGPARSLEIVLTGRRVDAEEALRIGLVTTVVPQADLVDAAVALAAVIGAKAPIATRIARLAARAAADGPASGGLIAETLGLAALHGTRDYAEGMRSFAEKRPAKFEGT